MILGAASAGTHGAAIAPSIIAATSVAVGAGLGGLVTWLIARQAASHAERIEDRSQEYESHRSRADRRETRREGIYVDMLVELNRAMWGIESTLPVVGAGGPVPEPPTDDWYHSLNARAGIFASSAVRALLAEFMKENRQFWLHVHLEREYAVDSAASGGRLRSGQAEAGETVMQQRFKAEDVRVRLRATVRSIEEQMARELEMVGPEDVGT